MCSIQVVINEFTLKFLKTVFMREFNSQSVLGVHSIVMPTSNYTLFPKDIAFQDTHCSRKHYRLTRKFFWNKEIGAHWNEVPEKLIATQLWKLCGRNDHVRNIKQHLMLTYLYSVHLFSIEWLTVTSGIK